MTLSVAIQDNTPQNGVALINSDHPAAHNTLHLDHNYFTPNGPDTVAAIPGASLYTSTYGWGAPLRQQIYHGSTSAPVTASPQAQPTDTIFRVIQGGAYSGGLDGGALNVNVYSLAGTGVQTAHRAQANVFNGQLDQFDSADAAVYQAQVVLHGAGGTAYSYYSNTSNVAHSFTASNGTPGVINLTAHNLFAGLEFLVANVGGGLPAGLAAHTRYTVKAVIDANSFSVADINGANVTISGAGTGTHYLTANSQSPMNPLTINSSHVDYIYGTGPFMANIVLQTIANSALAGQGIWFASDASGVQWSEGIVFGALTITNETIYDLSSSVTSIKIAGAHTDGIDLSAGSFSDLAIKLAAGFGLVNNGSDYILSFENGYGLVHDPVSHKTLLYGSSAPRGYLDGAWSPAANATFLHLYEGVTPSDRQVKWKDGGSIGAGDKVMVLV